MERSEILTITGKWHRENPVRISGKLSKSTLFRELYNACGRITESGRTFDDVIREGNYDEACRELQKWYLDRYETGFGMSRGTKGQKRMVIYNQEQYTFDALFGDKRQFVNYLMTDTPQSGNQDLCSFVMHMAVAFMLSPGALDGILQELGFHPLHVKNMHHLAIYTVLMSARRMQRIPADFNPLQKAKELYLKGCEILRQAGENEEEFRFDDLMTREIRQRLFLQGGLTNANFQQIVAANRQTLNTRHSLILRDFQRLAAVYLDIFRDYGPEIGQFGIYHMVNRFCKPISEKKFREQTGNMIDNYQKHPTRQMVILMWLYDYCFSFVRGIPMSNEAFQKVRKRLAKYDPQWAEDAKRYYVRCVFDVHGFVHGRKGRQTPDVFSGTDFVAWMNEMLYKRYGWGPLNQRLPFDYYVTRLAKLEIRYEDGYHKKNCRRIVCDGVTLPPEDKGIEAVPHPLYVIWELLEGLREVMAEKEEEFPLACGIYEQL